MKLQIWHCAECDLVFATDVEVYEERFAEIPPRCPDPECLGQDEDIEPTGLDFEIPYEAR